MDARRPLRTLPVLAFPACLAACSFILDFESLQSEPPPSTGGRLITGGSGGGDAAAGGTAGMGGDCPAHCFDDDPCTVDGCDEASACLEERSAGLTPDGLDLTVQGDAFFRVTAAATEDAYYLSALSSSGGANELTLYKVGSDATELSALATLSGLGLEDAGEPLGAAGLAVQAPADLLHLFVGLRSLDGEGTRLRRIVWNTRRDEMLSAGAVVSDSYWPDNPFLVPAVQVYADVPAVAWIQEDLSIGLDDGTEPRTLASGASATALTLLGSDQDEPVVLYGTLGDDEDAPLEGGVFTESPGTDPVEVVECETAPGAYLSASSASATFPGYWFASWTKFAAAGEEEAGYIRSEGNLFFCSGGTCYFPERDCPSEPVATRNSALIAAKSAESDGLLVEVVQATSVLRQVEGSDEVEGLLAVVQSGIDFGDDPGDGEPVLSELGPPLELGSMPTNAEIDLRGPDWPVLAHLAPNRYLLAWIQPGNGGDELRVQRYRMCLP